MSTATAETAGASSTAKPMRATQLIARVSTTADAQGRLVIDVPGLAAGEEVVLDVSIPVPAGQSGLDIIESYDGPRLFRTAAEVDEYIAEERASWD